MRRAGHCFSRALAGLLSLLLAGCAVTPSPPSSRPVGSELALSAVRQVGVPYRHGGDDPAYGFDCSGLVRYVAREALGMQLPRQAASISTAGEPVEVSQLQAGDLVFFDTLGQAFSHVGVYLGNGEFVHAPTRGGRVRIERLSQPYWRGRFSGARRLAGTGGSTAAAAAGAAVSPASATGSLSFGP